MKLSPKMSDIEDECAKLHHKTHIDSILGPNLDSFSPQFTYTYKGLKPKLSDIES